jgi:rubrerythrin
MKRFADLSEQEVLALAISNEEEDSRIYRDFAEGLRASFPDTAKMFEEMAAEEVHHRGMLCDLYRTRFGQDMPLVRRQDVRGFIRHKPVWLVRPLGLDEVRKYAAAISIARRKTSTRTSPKISASACSPRMSAPARTRPRDGCSCCNMCSPASLA